MNQKFVIVDDFYDIAHIYHKSIIEDQVLVTDETTQKLSFILGQPVKVEHAFNEKGGDGSITSNTAADWIAVIYLSLPPESIGQRGLSFFTHKKTQLDIFPNDYACQVNGWQNIDDVLASFDVTNKDDWEEYGNVFVKYNRCVIFKADHWHSYGNLNNSIIYQKLLITHG